MVVRLHNTECKYRYRVPYRTGTVPYLGERRRVGLKFARGRAGRSCTGTAVQRQRIRDVLEIGVELGPMLQHHVLHHFLEGKRVGRMVGSFSITKIVYGYGSTPARREDIGRGL